MNKYWPLRQLNRLYKIAGGAAFAILVLFIFLLRIVCTLAQRSLVMMMAMTLGLWGILPAAANFQTMFTSEEKESEDSHSSFHPLTHFDN